MAKAVGVVLDVLENLRSSNPHIVNFTYRDTGGKAIFTELDLLKDLALPLGFQGQSGLTMYPDGKVNVATVALFNEFGTIHIPARGFMRRSVKQHLGQIKAEIMMSFAKVATGGMTAMAAMQSIGEVMAGLIEQEIDTANSWAKPLARSTVEAKGHSRPLIETVLMRKSITWAIRKGSVRGSIIKQGKA